MTPPSSNLQHIILIARLQNLFYNSNILLKVLSNIIIKSALHCIGIVGFNVPLDTLQVISETILRVR